MVNQLAREVIVVGQGGSVEILGERPGWFVGSTAASRGVKSARAAVMVRRVDDAVVVDVDSTGVHPVYAGQADGRWIVGSSKVGVARALPADTICPKVVARRLGDWRRNPKDTLFDGIWRLAPGARVVVGGASGFDVENAPDECPDIDMEQVSYGSAEDAPDRLRYLLLERAAALAEVYGRVHVGLSGGVDSSALVAALVAQGHRPVVWLFDDRCSSEVERGFAEALIQRLDVESREIAVDPASLPEHFETAVEYADEPIINARAVAKFVFYRHVAESKPNCFATGVGADDLFAGKPEGWTVDESGIPGFAANGRTARELGRRIVRPGIDVSESKLEGSVDVPRLRRLQMECVTRPLVFSMELHVPAAMGIQTAAPYMDPAVIGFAEAMDREQLIGATRGKRVLRQAVEPLVGRAIAWQQKTAVYAPVGGGEESIRKRWADVFADLLMGRRLAALDCVHLPTVETLIDDYRTLPLSSAQIATIERVLMHLSSLKVLAGCTTGRRGR